MTTVDDFEVARQVAELLKGLDSERQVRVLRWVSESLGITQSSPARRETTAAASTAEVRAGGSADIKSFIAAKDPKSDNQFAAAVAYFYRFFPPALPKSDVWMHTKQPLIGADPLPRCCDPDLFFALLRSFD